MAKCAAAGTAVCFGRMIIRLWRQRWRELSQLKGLQQQAKTTASVIRLQMYTQHLISKTVSGYANIDNQLYK